MSYSIRENSQGGVVRSFLTKKEYRWQKDPSGANKRNAIDQLRVDDAAVRTANNARALPILNRLLTEKEHQSGDWLPDNRTTREKVEQETVHNVSGRGDATRNVWRERVATLEAELKAAYRPKDRKQIQKRLDLAHDKADEFDRELEERTKREEFFNRDEMKTAVLYAETWVNRLATNPNVPQGWVNGAKARLEKLKLTGNVEEFYTANDVFEAERAKVLGERAAAAQAEADRIQADADAIKREALETEPTPEPAAAA